MLRQFQAIFCKGIEYRVARCAFGHVEITESNQLTREREDASAARIRPLGDGKGLESPSADLGRLLLAVKQVHVDQRDRRGPDLEARQIGRAVEAVEGVAHARQLDTPVLRRRERNLSDLFQQLEL